MKEMKVVYRPIEEIKPYDRNPRKNDSAVANVAESIRQYGWQQPIVVDTDGVIIVGHTRYKAAKKLRPKKIPVVVADSLTPEQVRGYRLIDNKTNEAAEWDMDLLPGELEGLDWGRGTAKRGHKAGGRKRRLRRSRREHHRAKIRNWRHLSAWEAPADVWRLYQTGRCPEAGRGCWQTCF